MKRLVVMLVPSLGLYACAPDEGDGQDGLEIPEDAVDERVEIPPDEPGVYNIVSGEFVVEPGEDVMVCTSIDFDGDDLAYRDAISLQGKGGHHAVMLGAKEPLPNGTLEDCSDSADMAKYEVLIVPQEIPDGYGTILTGGRHMVMQSHYINTTDKPMLVRDIVQLKTVEIDAVRTWAAPLAVNTIDFEIPAGKTAETSFDCTIDEDVELLMLGGHMHEWGSKFQVQVGPSVDALELLYLADPWKAEYRDLPPVSLYLEDPLPISKGTIIRTQCTWDNTEAEMLDFPHEMCTTFGIVAGVQKAIECRHGE